MLVEMLLLVLIAVVVFGFVLAPMILPALRDRNTARSVEQETPDESEPVPADNRPARETS